MADTTDTVRGFDPGRYLRKVNGADYLEVKWRLVWLRSDYPDAAIKTEMLQADDKMAIFRADVFLPTGGQASGHGSESAADFGDYIEKAETKAIGRALSALGYGTQFAWDHDHGGIVDSPIGGDGERPQASDTLTLTQGQESYARSLQAERGLTNEVMLQQTGGKKLAELTRREASQLIDWMKALPAAQAR